VQSRFGVAPKVAPTLCALPTKNPDAWPPAHKGLAGRA
jgi:hypothetical protein